MSFLIQKKCSHAQISFRRKSCRRASIYFQFENAFTTSIWQYRSLITVLLCVFVGGYAPAMSAQDAEVDKQTMLAVYTAFECSALAKTAEYEDEAPRFRDIEYRAGLAAHEALAQGSVTREGLRVPIPALNLLTIEGPSVHFVLGVHYQFAFSMLMRDVISSIGLKGTRQDRIAEAHKRYTEKGCSEFLFQHAPTSVASGSGQP